MSHPTNGTPEPSRILSLDGSKPGSKARDDQGRMLSHNATVLEAHEIAIEEGNKMHAFYMNQIPNHVARMIHDALLHYGIIQLTPEAMAATDIVPEAPSPAAEAIHAMPDAGTITGPGLHHGGEPAVPSDNIKVEEPAAQDSGDAESTPAPVAQS